MRVIEYKSDSNMIVEFQDEFRFRKKVAYTNFKSGSVKNPYDKTVYGIGCHGYGRHKAKENGIHSDIYGAWSDMIRRCYCDKKRHPTYCGICSVCKEWLNFQVFADWYEKHRYECDGRLHIDKDILFPGNKVYSPETCILVPQRINELFTTSTKKSDGLPQGIIKTKSNKYNVQYCGINFGTFKTYEAACEKYVIEKRNKIVDVANEYKNIIPLILYDSLLAYEVKIVA